MENIKFFCHIIGLNQVDKNILLSLPFMNKFHTIDLDSINKEIFDNIDLKKMFKQYQHFKGKKNEKYKDIEKKMNIFWEKNFTNFIENNMLEKKKIIVIGNNCHYRNISKKVNINTNNRFIMNTNNDIVKHIIKYNVETYQKNIVNGTYSLDNLDFEFIKKSRKKIEENYINNGYLLHNFDQIKTILYLLSTKNKKIDGLYISLTEPYNVTTKIHPKKNNKLIAYHEPVHALLGSFNWKEDDLEKVYKGKTIKLIEKKPNSLSKLNDKRFLYYVEGDTFIPHDKGNNMKFFSQVPVMIIDSDKIPNVYKKLNELGLF